MVEEKERKKIGSVQIPDEYKGWMKYVDSSGDVYVMQPGGQKRDPELQNALDAAVGAAKAKFVADGKVLRKAVADARAALKSDLGSEALRARFDEAKENLKAFKESRSKLQKAAVKAARDKVLAK